MEGVGVVGVEGVGVEGVGVVGMEGGGKLRSKGISLWSQPHPLITRHWYTAREAMPMGRGRVEWSGPPRGSRSSSPCHAPTPYQRTLAGWEVEMVQVRLTKVEL